VALWAVGVQIPPPTRHLPVRTAKAPEAIFGLRGSRFPRIPPSALRDHPRWVATPVESDRADSRRHEHEWFGLAPCRKQALNRPLPANLTGRESGDVFPAIQRLDREDHGGRPTPHVRIHLDADAVGRIARSELCMRVKRIPISQVFRSVDDRPFRGQTGDVVVHDLRDRFGWPPRPLGWPS
jgi:hypothetical protein